MTVLTDSLVTLWKTFRRFRATIICCKNFEQGLLFFLKYLTIYLEFLDSIARETYANFSQQHFATLLSEKVTGNLFRNIVYQIFKSLRSSCLTKEKEQNFSVTYYTWPGKNSPTFLSFFLFGILSFKKIVLFNPRSSI